MGFVANGNAYIGLMAKISIIVPVYNVEPFLRPCLDSILSQTISDWECVLVDDGSKDNSGQICDEYAGRDNRFVVVHKQNEGVAKARITAFEHSHGELITFIDSDDTVLPLYLEKLSRPILEENADMVSCDFNAVRDDIIKKARKKRSGIFVGEEIKDFVCNSFLYDTIVRDYGIACFLWTKMVRREYIQEGLKQGEGFWFAEDQIALLQMLLQIKKLVILPDNLYNYVLHEGQVTHRYEWGIWDNIIRMLSKVQELTHGLPVKAGLRKRTWLHIKRTIDLKMLSKDMAKDTFIRHLSQMRETPYMKEYFSHLTTGFGKKDLKIYWLLKLRLYGVFYDNAMC